MDVEAQQTTLSATSRSQNCVAAFEQCLAEAEAIHPRERSLIDDQRSRFLVWAGNIGALSSTRASLDHRLRETPEVLDIILALLDSLEKRLRECRRILASLSPPGGQSVGSPLEPVHHGLSRILGQIEFDIDLLNKFSNTIRRASKASQHQKADKLKILDDDGTDIEPHLLTIFANSLNPAIGDIIRRRLAGAMVLRRKRILYRRSRQQVIGSHARAITRESPPSLPNLVLKSAPANPTPPGNTPLPEPINITMPVVPTTPSQVPSATTLRPEGYQKATTPSIVSQTRTVPVGKHPYLPFPPPPYPASRYLEGKSSGEQSENQAPPVGDVTCQFCFQVLPISDVINANSWRYAAHLVLTPT